LQSNRPKKRCDCDSQGQPELVTAFVQKRPISNKPDYRRNRLLRLRRLRECRRRAEQRYELTPFQSIELHTLLPLLRPRGSVPE
jgi:hypothetical protein